MTKPGRATLTNKRSEVLRLINGADGVEQKLTVRDVDPRSAVAVPEMDATDAKCQVVFLDTPDLTLSQHDGVVRARRVEGQDNDSVITLRPLVPSKRPVGPRTHRVRSARLGEVEPVELVAATELLDRLLGGLVTVVSPTGRPLSVGGRF